jgi:hypothetical protein
MKLRVRDGAVLDTFKIDAAFWWWFVGSMLAFLLVTALGVADRAACGALWLYRKARMARHQDSTAADANAALLSPSRRCFLERTAVPDANLASKFATMQNVRKIEMAGIV